MGEDDEGLPVGEGLDDLPARPRRAERGRGVSSGRLPDRAGRAERARSVRSASRATFGLARVPPWRDRILGSLGCPPRPRTQRFKYERKNRLT